MEQEGKKMTAFYAATTRSIVDKVNTLGLQKEDIVQIVQGSEGYVLLYYI